MTVAAISSRSGRQLNARGRARRAKRVAAKRQRLILVASASLAFVIGAPLSVAAYMGVDSDFPGVSAAKSFLAMMADRSPGDRTKAELTKTKHKTIPVPTQRALGKITKPEPPKEFVEAIAPPLPKIDQVPAALAPPVEIGPILLTPQPPSGGGIIIPPEAPPPGGGGPTPPTEVPPTPPTTPPAVPEPGTWATMLMGFGLVGWMMRRRRRTVPVVRFG